MANSLGKTGRVLRPCWRFSLGMGQKFKEISHLFLVARLLPKRSMHGPKLPYESLTNQVCHRYFSFCSVNQKRLNRVVVRGE